MMSLRSPRKNIFNNQIHKSLIHKLSIRNTSDEHTKTSYNRERPQTQIKNYNNCHPNLVRLNELWFRSNNKIVYATNSYELGICKFKFRFNFKTLTYHQIQIN